MPPHEVYIEAFVGSGAIFRNKKPAKASIVIDIDADVACYWRAHRPTSTTVICGDARSLLRDRTYTGRELVYCDPPYPRSTRRWQFPLYRHEMTDRQHRELQALHDWRYLGNGFRERERIKRKQSRWRRQLSSMPAMERLAMLDLLLELATPGTARGSR